MKSNDDQNQKIIVLLGAPGSGKGTQARLLADKYGWPQISTGDILREMSTSETPLGIQLRETMAAGQLVSDEALAEVIKTRTARQDCRGNFILDGFPRTMAQAKLLEEMASQQSREIQVLSLDVGRETLMKRLTGRRTCQQCGKIYNIYLGPPKKEGFCDLDGGSLKLRADDDERSIGVRLEAYDQMTSPLNDYFRRNGMLTSLNAEQPVEKIFGALCRVIGRRAEA